MRTLPTISQKARKNLVGLSILLGLGAYYTIYRSPILQRSEFWQIVKGRPLLYAILGLISAGLTLWGFETETNETNNELEFLSSLVRLATGALVLLILTAAVCMIAGMLVFELASISLSTALWISGIAVVTLWLAFRLDTSRN